MYWTITLILGIFFIFLIGYLLLIKFNLKSDIFLFSVGLGTFFIIFLIFSLNQYFKIQIDSSLIWLATLASLILLLLINYKYFIKEFSLHNLNFKLKFDIFAILILIIFLFAFYKAIFFPVTADDAVLMYAFISEKAWNDGFLPQASSSFMEMSYAWPNTNFALFLYNYFFGLNFGFDEIFVKILVPFFALLNLLVFYKLSLILFKKKEMAQLTVAIFVGSIIFSSGIVQEYTTMYELFFPLLAVYAFILYQESKSYRTLILTGIFFAATLMIKYTLIPFVIFFLFSILLVKKNAKIALKFALIIIPISLIFYLRNIVVYKNPVFPYFFGGENYHAELFRIQNTFANVPSYTIEQFFVTLIPISFFVFIFFVLFLLDYIRSNKTDPTMNILILTAILHLTFWFLTSAFILETQGMRHIIYSFALISIFSAAYLYKKLGEKKLSIWFALAPLISTLIIFAFYFTFVTDPYFEYSKNLLILTFAQPIFISTTLILSKFNINKKIVMTLLIISFLIIPIGFNAFAKRTAPWEFPSREEVIRRYYPDHSEAFQYINKNLPQDAMILSFYNQRYYIKREILPADSPKVEFLYENIPLDEALKRLEQLNINYIMISEMEKNLPFWGLSVIHKAHEERNLKLAILYKNNEVTLYKIN